MLSVTVDDANMRRAFRQAPAALLKHMRGAFREHVQDVEHRFVRAFLGRPDDRNPADPLNRRPINSMGLVNRSGQLSRSFTSKLGGLTFETLEAKVGFFSFLQARIARVHQYGTISKGGTLPDIRPRRAKYLAVPIRSIGAALSGKGVKIVKLKKVGIPKRLKFFETWQHPNTVQKLTDRVRGAVNLALKEAVKK